MHKMKMKNNYYNFFNLEEYSSNHYKHPIYSFQVFLLTRKLNNILN